jgi:hypothetical protein
MPLGGVGVAALGAGVLGAGATAYAANKAASTQKNAAALATQVQANNINRAIGQEAPYTALGSQAAGQLSSQLGDLTSPVTMTQAQLEQTPGYQFQLEQGLKSVQNSAAARGLGGNASSPGGPGIKGALAYSQGLANSTYLDQWNIANTNKQNAYNRLLQAATLGNTATQNITNVESGGTNQIAQNQVNAGAAGAGAAAATAQSISSGANQFANNYLLGSIYGNGAQNAKNNQAYGADPAGGANTTG